MAGRDKDIDPASELVEDDEEPVPVHRDEPPVLVLFRGSERILKGNPDVDDVITTPERPSV